MSALPPEADFAQAREHVREGPIAEVERSIRSPRPKAEAATSKEGRRIELIYAAISGLNMNVARLKPGKISLSKSSHLLADEPGRSSASKTDRS
jgi:hypothetical protein